MGDGRRELHSVNPAISPSGSSLRGIHIPDSDRSGFHTAFPLAAEDPTTTWLCTRLRSTWRARTQSARRTLPRRLEALRIHTWGIWAWEEFAAPWSDTEGLER